MESNELNRPLRIALASTQKRWRGGEEQAMLLARGLRSRGHECVVFARRRKAFAERMAHDEGFTVVEYSGRWWNLGTLLSTRRALSHLRPDVLHCNDPHALSAAGLASLGQRIPVRVGTRRVAFPVRSPRTYSRLCDCVVCVSHAVAETCVTGGIPEERLRVIHDGVDGSTVGGGDWRRGRLALGVGKDDIVLLSVGALSESKGHRYLLDAVPRMIQRFPRVRVALAGSGELENELRQQVQDLDIAQYVRFLGHRADVPDLLRAADLFVMPSQVEGLGTALIEAMFAGCPVVASAVGGIPEVIGSRGAGERPVGWCVPPRDSRSLAEAIMESLSNETLRRQRSEQARRRVEREFSADKMVDATLDLYRELLARREAGSPSTRSAGNRAA